MGVIDYVLPGAKVRSVWGNNVADEVNQLRGFMYPISNLGGMPWHVGPQIRGADGWSFIPTSVGSEVMGYRGATAATTKYAWATRMLVGSTPTDALAAKGQLVVTGGKLAIDASNLIWWPDWGGNMWMQDVTWLRWDKSIYLATGILATDGTFAIKTGGAVTGGYVADMVGAARIRGICNADFASAFHPTWSGLHFRATSVTGDAGLTAWSNSQAPIWCASPGLGAGETWFAYNSAQSGLVPLNASAFTVGSSARIKQDVSDVSVLDRIMKLGTKRYKLKVRPKSLRPTKKFADINRRWTEKGKTALTARAQDHESVDHDCALDDHCSGTDDSPCAIVANDTHEFGLIAEDVYEVFPEAVRVDGEMIPFGIDVNQLAGIAIGGISEMAQVIKQLTDRVEALEAV